MKKSLAIALALLCAQAAVAAEDTPSAPVPVQLAPGVLSTQQELARCAKAKEPCVVLSQVELKKLAQLMFNKGVEAGVKGTMEELQKRMEESQEKSGS